MRMKFLGVIALVFIAAATEAQLSKAAQEWRKGPEKFLLTDAEEKAWKSVKTDEDAANFIDLFWARRDPTAGTPRNEFREEFLTRVRYADASFNERRRRGALSERGQVYILLGPPEEGSLDAMQLQGPAGMSAASARSSDHVVWTWPRELAAKLGVIKLTAIFNQVVGSDAYARDTKYGEFSNVSEKAINSNITAPNMTAVPDWAYRFSKESLSGTQPGPTKGDAKPAGRIGRLVLIDDISKLNLMAATDPIAALTPVKEFPAGGELVFVLEYCDAPGAIKIDSRIANMMAVAELEPMAMKAVAGCGAVPSMLNLGALKPGSYELAITTIEQNGARLTTKAPFTIK